jgi:hypothetical protein
VLIGFFIPNEKAVYQTCLGLGDFCLREKWEIKKASDFKPEAFEFEARMDLF